MEDVSADIPLTQVKQSNGRALPGTQQPSPVFKLNGEFTFTEASTNRLKTKPRPSGNRKFVKVSPDVDVKALCKWMSSEWNINFPPGLVISVAGGSWDFPRNAVVKEIFRKGLVDAAVNNEDSTVIITGGTHAGVMKYTARGLSDYEWAYPPTLRDVIDTITLGVAAWGSLQQEVRDILENAATNNKVPGLDVRPSTRSTIASKDLDPNHSHFIFVDDTDTVGDRWPVEREMRVKLEREMRTIGETDYITSNQCVNRRVQISCSSSNHRTCHHTQIGLNDKEAWIADDANGNQWVSVDLTSPRRVKGVEMKGNPQADMWVTKFKVLYSDDEENWKVVDDREFDGTKDRDTSIAIRRFSSTVRARFFKIQPTAWHGAQPSMRCDLQVCKDVAVVCVLVEGGMNSIRQACSSVQAGTPLIVVADSGRAANVLAHAFREDHEDWSKIKADLQHMIKREADVDSTLELIREAAKKPYLLNVYDGSSDEGMQGAMLEALMKDNQQSMDVNIQLALLWEYHEALKDHMFGSSFTYNWKAYRVDEIVLGALLRDTILKNHLGFVKLLIDNDVIDLNKCVTWGFIEQLYSKVCVDELPDHMRKITQSSGHVLDKVDAVMQELAFVKFSYYRKDQRGNENDPVEDPYRHLFIFALLCGYDDMALTFWEEDSEPMASALVASNMYKNQAMKIPTIYKEQKECLETMDEEFADLAYESLNACEKATKTLDTVNMVLRNVPSWGDTTCLKLAELSDNLQFIGHTGIQTLVDNIWRHGLDPPGRNASFYQKVKSFYLSPRVSFYQNLVMHLMFLVLFSYVMLSDQLKSRWPQKTEYMLMAWVLTFILEEMRQVIAQSPSRYIAIPWNWNDIFNLGLFTFGMILRLIDGTKNGARIALAFSLFGFFFRLLHNLTPFKFTGPIVLMIGRMIFDVLVILLIVIILVVGYGITTTAILHPHAPDPRPYVWIMTKRAYFQMYGELFKEDYDISMGYSGRASQECSSNETLIALGALRCPENLGWGLLCLALWMVCGNALLLQLLVAMFSNTYNKVEESNDLFWRFMRYDITKEFYKKPSLPPPFIILIHLWRICRYSFKSKWKWSSPTLKRTFEGDQERQIKALERQLVYDYIIKKRRDEEEETRKENVPESLVKLENQLALFERNVDERFAKLGPPTSSPTITTPGKSSTTEVGPSTACTTDTSESTPPCDVP